MNNQNLIIYDFQIIYKILHEIQNKLNFKITNVNKKDLKNLSNITGSNYILLTRRRISNYNNQIVLDKLPIKISKLIEKLNIEFLKTNYKDQSNYEIGSYQINLNSRNILNKTKSLKLTEKEINTILYLHKSKKPIKIKELQLNVWDHKSLLETHTVETHIHRLRKKIREEFGDENFIISSKQGYEIN